MRSFFDLPHIFIAFHPGSGGNFLAGIFDKIIHQDTNALPVLTSNGTSHTVYNPTMSFGVTADEQLFFDSRESREHYYLEKIKSEFNNTEQPLVAWTHDFSNIEFYRKYFKNCKIVCITANSKEEMLSSVFMNISKMMVRDIKDWPIHPDVKIFRAKRLEKGCKYVLRKLLKPEFLDRVDSIYSNREKESSNAVVKLAMTYMILGQLGILNYIKPNSGIEHEVFNYILCPNTPESSNVQYEIGPSVFEYTTLADACLPYEYMATSNVESLSSTISVILGRELLLPELEFVHNSYYNYLNNQNMMILNDPIAYFNSIKKECDDLIRQH